MHRSSFHLIVNPNISQTAQGHGLCTVVLFHVIVNINIW